MDKITISIPGTDTDLAEMQGDDAHRLELFLDFEKCSIDVEVRLAGDRSWTFREHGGHAMTVRIEPQPRADARELLGRIVTPFAELCARYSSEWDGSNYVARWADPERAEELRYKIERIAEEHTVTDVRGSLWEAAEWLESSPPDVAAGVTDDALEAAASEIQAAANEDGIHLYGLDEYLERLRDEANAEADDE